jgi:CRISPR-associated protein Cas2
LILERGARKARPVFLGVANPKSKIRDQKSKMFYVISYDIPDDKRRTKAAHLLEGYGERVQKSVFEAHLDERGYADLRKRLARLIKAEEDNVRFYRLCAECRRTVETVGKVNVTPEPGLVIV